MVQDDDPYATKAARSKTVNIMGVKDVRDSVETAMGVKEHKPIREGFMEEGDSKAQLI